ERSHMANVVLTCLLVKTAHRHVFDHTRAQRADGLAGSIGRHRGSSLELKVAGPLMLGIGYRRRHVLSFSRSPPPNNIRRPSRESGFVLCTKTAKTDASGQTAAPSVRF